MFIVGADIGQARDPTALGVIETAADKLQVRHLERLPLGTPYPQVVDRIADLVGGLPGAELVVDATGVGRPIVDQIPVPRVIRERYDDKPKKRYSQWSA